MSDLIVESFTLDHYRALLGAEITPEKLNAGIVNLATGSGFALLDGPEVLAIGGVRVQGIGQAWAMLSERAKERRITIMRAARDVLDECMQHERLYRVYAEATVDEPAWFKWLGFQQVKTQDRLFVR